MDFALLLQQPESRRDDAWETDFLGQFAGMKVQIEGEEPRQGPDGWPYLFARTGPSSTEPVKDVVQWCAGRGIGLVINPHKMLPDYIFPYGMLWNFVESGRFLAPIESAKGGDAVPGKGAVAGPPTEKYLPPYVREVLREFLGSQGFAQPRILVISSADYKQADLVFSLESLSPLARSKHQEMADNLAWFLPLHYTIVLGSESGLPTFTSL
jgi:hypothetical protein